MYTKGAIFASFFYQLMFLTNAKKYFSSGKIQSFFQRLYDVGFSPTLLTIISAIFKILVIVALWYKEPVLAAVAVIFDFLFDFLDGGVARATGKSTVRGALLDFVSDRIFRTLWLFAAAYSGLVSYEVALLTMMVMAFAYFMNDFVEFKKLKHLTWLLAYHHFIFWGMLFGNMEIWMIVGVVVNGIFTLINIVSVFVMNKERRA